MEIESVTVDGPVPAKALGFVLRLMVRFVELPFLFSVFFLVFYITTTALRAPEIEKTVMAIFLYPLTAVFHYPDTFSTNSFTPVLQVTAFWLLIFHILWELLSVIFKKSGFFSFRVKQSFIKNGLWLALLIALISTVFYDRFDNTTSKWLMAVFLVVITTIGQLSYWFGSFFSQASAAFFAYKGPQKDA